MKKRLLLLIIFITLLLIIEKLLVPKYMTELIEGNMINEYYKEEKNHEVIFIGDCEVYANYSPMVIYEETGITSYIRGTPQQLIWQSYYILKETLKYEVPKIVILNVNAMRYNEPVSEAYNRLTIDKMKWSKEKIGIINSSMTPEENILTYIFPIIRYHSRYDKLTHEDFEYLFKTKTNTHNGFLINKEVKKLSSLPVDKKLLSYDFGDKAYEYLEKITTLCKENNIKLILIKSPSLYPYWYNEYEKQIKEYAEKNNLDYYNFKDKIEEIGIDFNIDTYDGGLHLNLSGATKMSKYIGKILKENYNLTDNRNNSKIDNIYQEKLTKYYEEVGDKDE